MGELPYGADPAGAGSAFQSWLASPLVKAFLPLPVFVALAPVIWFFFRSTWRELDLSAQAYRGALLAERKYDLRPVALFVIAGLTLTMQEYYGGRATYDDVIRPWLLRIELAHPQGHIHLAKYDELYGYVWWVFSRVAGYVLIPFPLYKLLFPQDSLLDFGLRVKGFTRHLWIYATCLGIVMPALWLVSRQPDFGTYYPFYKSSSRSVFDLLVWEGIYLVQFFALELFFRGLWLGALRRSLGSGAIFAMAVPYCMIHYGKPYLEACGAIVAGIVLGSLAMRTKSIYAGFLVHATVAVSMDLLSLSHRHAIPVAFWAPG